MSTERLITPGTGFESCPKGQIFCSLLSAVARLLIIILSMASAQAALAAKTDVVQLVNGDRLTCEIKQLERGRLKVSTDSMGTVYLEWKDIVRLSSPAQFIFELENGRRARGTLVDSGTDGQLLVRYRERERVLEMAEVVWIDPLKDGTIANRWDGSISIGLDYAKTNNDSSFTGAFDARRRAEDFQFGISATAFLRSQDDTTDSQRATLELEYRGLLEERWYWAAVGSLERNDELGIDLRTLAGGGYGRFLRQTNRTLWSATGGAAIVNEQRAGDQDAENNVEGFFNTRYEYFTYDTPKTSLNTSLSVFPSITDSGRVRSNLDFYVRRELVEDLFLELRLYGSYDNRPPDEGEKSDYGLVTSLGYSF